MLPFQTERFQRIERIRERLLRTASEQGTPLYVFDEEESIGNLDRFQTSFRTHGSNPIIFFAVKSCPAPPLLKALVRAGIGLDVSSTQELGLALKAKPASILYTGPAKTQRDLLEFRSAIEKFPAIQFTLHIDSFQELARLQEIFTEERSPLRCGIRVHTERNGRWSKFGIPVQELSRFIQQAQQAPGLSLQGIQFHESMIEDVHAYTDNLQEIAKIGASLEEKVRNQIQFIDIGGGFPAPSFEAAYTWNPDLDFRYDNSEELEKILRDSYHPRFISPEYTAIGQFSSVITECWEKAIEPIFPKASLWTEPGSYLSHSVLHMLLSVADIKPNRRIILDGGTNAIGYERYQYLDYVPTFNLSQFSLTKEEPYLLYGCLCTPNDVWGHYLYGEGIALGDVLCIPYQGDYTLTYAQGNFITPVPSVVSMR